MFKKKCIRHIQLFLLKQYTSIGGQAVIEGVMMRSPNAFVIAVRKADGSIMIRKDQWFGLGKRFDVFKKPLLRGILVLIETMLNGIVSLNYSANIAMNDELVAEAKKKGEQAELDVQNKINRKNEKIDWQTGLTLLASMAMGFALFVLLPHGLTALLAKVSGSSWDLDSFSFHFIDGVFKALIFLLYIYLIGLIPDIRRVFQYHGAEHKSISTFEAQEELSIANAKKFTTIHPRCGTTFVFFLIFISIILFSGIFTLIKIGEDWQPMVFWGVAEIGSFKFVDIARHLVAIGYKFLLMFPVAGISYELIKLSGKYPHKLFCRVISYPGMLLQRLTTKEPDEKQLEIGLASLKAVLFLEEKFNLKTANKKIVSREEVQIKSLSEIEVGQIGLKEFLE
jgi:uncharacterized protein YqhQ